MSLLIQRIQLLSQASDALKNLLIKAHKVIDGHKGIQREREAPLTNLDQIQVLTGPSLDFE